MTLGELKQLVPDGSEIEMTFSQKHWTLIVFDPNSQDDRDVIVFFKSKDFMYCINHVCDQLNKYKKAYI